MTSIKLTKSSDWDQWISYIKSHAKDSHIWDVINPQSTAAARDALRLAPPIEPVIPANETGFTQYRMAILQYNVSLQKYDRQQAALRDIKTKILNTMSKEAAVHIENQENTYASDILVILSGIYDLPLATKQAKLRREWDALQQGRQRGQALAQWLEQWVTVHSRLLHLDMFEAKEPRASDAFASAVRPFATTFSETHAYNQSMAAANAKAPTLIQLIQNFRAYAERVGLSLESTGTASTAHNAQFRGRNTNGDRLPPCKIEPDIRHYYADCPYLNPSVRPKNWKADPSLTQKTTELLKGPHGDTIRSKLAARQDRLKTQQDKTTTASAKATFPAFRTSTSHFGSWIMDTGSTDHVCNESMRHRFVKTHNAPTDEFIEAGTQNLAIEAYGTVDVLAEGVDGLFTVTLTNVALIPRMGCNLISVAILEKKGALWDMSKGIVSLNNNPIFRVKRNGNLYVVEADNNPGKPSHSSFPTFKTTTSYEWHRILGHVGAEPILRLPAATEGAHISENDTPVPLTHACEPCAISRSRQIISRNPNHEHEAKKCFERVSYDLMDNGESFNHQRWITHIHDTFSNYSFVYTHLAKNDTIDAIESLINLAKQRFNLRINFFRSDQEQTLGGRFADLCREHAITWEPSAPHTQAQNGHAERHANLLTTRAMALRNQARLPEELWPEIYMAAGYLLNRTPCKKLHWKTPFEILHGSKPDLSHLRVYGCKAYVKKPKKANTPRLTDRAHVGYLIGYSSRNIFRIWVPGYNRIFRSRDVIFDENSFYSPDAVPDHEITSTAEQISTALNEFSLDDPLLLDLPETHGLAIENPALEFIWEPQIASSPVPPPAQTETSTGDIPSPPSSQRSIHGPNEPDDELQTSENYAETCVPAPGTPKSLSTIPNAQDEYENTSLLSELDPSVFEDAVAHIGNEPAFVPSNRSDDDSDAAQLAKRLQGPSRIDSSINASNILPHGSRRRAMAATGNSQTRWHQSELPNEPTNPRRLKRHLFRAEFQAAYEREICALNEMKAYKPMSKTHAEGAHVIPLTVVYKYKLDNEGFLLPGDDGFKARICVRGDKQLEVLTDTYAATLAFTVIRLLLGITAIFNLSTMQFDMKTAYLHAQIKGNIFCWPLPGMAPDDNIIQLLRALYGLRESPALWQATLTEALMTFGLKSIPGVPCFFMNDHLLVFFFVDDVVALFAEEDRSHAEAFSRFLHSKFRVKNLGELRWFLALNIIRNRKTREIWLSQESYIQKITAKYLSDADHTRSTSTPLPPGCSLVPNEDQATKASTKLFQQKMGSLQFAATVSRPDISFSVSALSEFCQNPSESHHQLANHVFAYLASTPRLSIHFSASKYDSTSVFMPWADASFANDAATRKSRTGVILQLFGGSLMWKSIKQRTVTTSSTEAELTALSLLAKEALWWERLFRHIHFAPGHQVQLHCDNRQTIRLVCEDSQRLDTKLRHIDVHNHWLRQEVKSNTIRPIWTPTAKMVADGLTKPLPKGKHHEFVSILGLSEPPAAAHHHN